MPFHQKYKNRIYVGFNFEKDMLDGFKELCYKERTKMGDKLNQFIKNELERNSGIELNNNPLGIKYGGNGKGDISNNIEPLDKYFQDNFVTIPQ